MKNNITGFISIDPNKQVSKPKKQVADIQLNRKDLVVINGSVVDKRAFSEWEKDKPNASWE